MRLSDIDPGAFRASLYFTDILVKKTAWISENTSFVAIGVGLLDLIKFSPWKMCGIVGFLSE